MRLKGLQVVLLTPECTDEEVEEEGCQPRHLSDEAVDSFSSAQVGGLIEEMDKVRPRGSQVVLLTLDCTDEEVEEGECQPHHLSDEEVDSGGWTNVAQTPKSSEISSLQREAEWSLFCITNPVRERR